ncbi:hypothetical protein F1643_00200 [Azospirillum sp. INR13]|uniref:hypothetical protein n=1 Tax=Azospirillum sp. INR13 TaxID=2596919 RepID=UPI0018926035|nr:hypothetical protein [Azospirillum sp. INR13]MBF5093109.1 hypothetical protein [Azospirillum sp. INR13]
MRQRFRVRPDDADRFLRDFADIVTLNEACGGIGLRAVKLRLDAAGVRPAGAGGKIGRPRPFYLREEAETALLMVSASRAPAETGRDLDACPFDEDEAPEEPRPR